MTLLVADHRDFKIVPKSEHWS